MKEPIIPIRIFLVDDDQLYSEALQHFLTEENGAISVTAFISGESMFEHMGSRPDIIVLDYYLNSSSSDSLDGMAVLKRIKALHPDVRVIMLSAQDSIHIASDMLDNGAFDYVSKNESAFVRIRNIISNISKTNKVIHKINKEVSVYKKVNIIAIIIIVLLFIISRLYNYFSR